MPTPPLIVDVPGYGPMHIRRLDGNDVSRDRQSRWCSGTAQQSADLPYIVGRALVDDDGRRIFTDDDQAKLSETMPIDAMLAIVGAALRFSGMMIVAGLSSPPVPRPPVAVVGDRTARPQDRRGLRSGRRRLGAAKTRPR